MLQGVELRELGVPEDAVSCAVLCRLRRCCFFNSAPLAPSSLPACPTCACSKAPKKISAVAFSKGGSVVLAADKFGDVLVARTAADPGDAAGAAPGAAQGPSPARTR